MVNAKDIDYYSNINGAIDYLQNRIDNNIELRLSDEDIQSLKNDWKNFSKIDTIDEPIYNFNELTKRLSQINFDDNKIEFNEVEEEFGDEYKEGVASYEKTIQIFRRSVSRLPKLTDNGMVAGGRGGIGKTYNVEMALSKIGPQVRPEDPVTPPIEGKTKWMIHSGGSIDKKVLYEEMSKVSGPNDILVLDDCDSAITSQVVQNMLKQALVGKKVRHMVHPSPNSKSSEDIPSTMDYQGKLIWLTNMDLEGDESINALVSRFSNDSFDPSSFSILCYAIHSAFDTNQYPYGKDPEYTRRAHWTARFMWANRKYFINDKVNLRAAPKIINGLAKSDDDIDAVLQTIKKQFFYADPNDKSKQRKQMY